MTPTPVIYRNFEIDIDDRKILRLIGYRKRDSEVKSSVKKLIAEEIGVRLHRESWMMTPRKSLSFRINFYRDQSLTTRKIIYEKQGES